MINYMKRCTLVASLTILVSISNTMASPATDFQQQADRNRQEFERQRAISQQAFQQQAEQNKQEFERQRAISQQQFQQQADKNRAEFERQRVQSQQEFEQKKAQSQQRFQQQVDKNQAEFEQKKNQNQQAFQEQANRNQAASEQKKLDAQKELERKKAQAQQNTQKKSDSAGLGWLAIIGIAIIAAFAILGKFLRGRGRKGPSGYQNRSMYPKYQREDLASKKEAIIAAGKAGEKQTAFHLGFLPDGFTAYHNVYIQVDGQSAENDHIVVGPSGVVLIETKNYAGTIHVRPEGWIRENGGKEEGCSSPVAQSERHRMVFQRWLQKNNIMDVPVHIVVAIANSKAIIKGSDPNCPVIKSESIASWIHQLAQTLDQTKVEAINMRLCDNVSGAGINEIPMPVDS